MRYKRKKSRHLLVAMAVAAAAWLLLGQPAALNAQGEPGMQENHTLKIGWAHTDITPTEPVILTGQTFARVSEGVKKPLTATILALESTPPGQPASRVVMISLDLLSVSECIRAGVREHLRQRLPELDPQALLFCATHTHTALPAQMTA